jgi:hypothetical protein
MSPLVCCFTYGSLPRSRHFEDWQTIEIKITARSIEGAQIGSQ